MAGGRGGAGGRVGPRARASNSPQPQTNPSSSHTTRPAGKLEGEIGWGKEGLGGRVGPRAWVFEHPQPRTRPPSPHPSHPFSVEESQQVRGHVGG